MNPSLDLVLPTTEQIEILYAQLKERTHTISHKKLSSVDEHKRFVVNNPYRAWFIVKENMNAIGNIYVQFDNSIGLNCGDDVTEEQIKKVLVMLFAKLPPLEAIPSVRFGDFFVNVSSSNSSLQNKLHNLGFMETQRTYVAKNK